MYIFYTGITHKNSNLKQSSGLGQIFSLSALVFCLSSTIKRLIFANAGYLDLGCLYELKGKIMMMKSCRYIQKKNVSLPGR
ncbi:MAG: hypothetical protein A2277_10125 [Desulfobacterales bacterium RIFOXYA12_FULL_46_15]|nr:MAG: hypothetical protein A2277_10125 [Desulfobacterales bacterium RIFOXYA12_FULL_46_15]